jgi:hypothetical protein
VYVAVVLTGSLEQRKMQSYLTSEDTDQDEVSIWEENL